MHNLQLIDTLDGGYFVFKRSDYIIDEGIYSELYACFFGTSSPDWWADSAFSVQSEKVASRTENALRTHNSNSISDINLIKKAVSDDLDRFTSKNPKIEVKNASIVAYSNNAIMIMVELTGNTDAFNFIYTKTKESLDNIKYIMYDI
ncbi:MAG: hypothetical protein PF485_05695 [Bacteroidales bacterium]|jgi:hypothetical protein|nr:hypothetical protein [Bacteroidales bacterium]